MSANGDLYDALIRHQVLLMRYSAVLQERVQRELDGVEEEIADKIRSRLMDGSSLETDADVRRLERLLEQVQRLRQLAWDRATGVWMDELGQLAELEPELFSQILQTVLPVQVAMSSITRAQALALLEEDPFEGRVMRDWARAIAEEDLRRISAEIRAGMIAGEGSAVIARRVVGSARLRGTDGATEITRRGAQALTRTAINHLSHAARRAFIKANADLFDGELFVATLDSRTTAVCRANDGQVFPLNKGPMPPLHFNCRSLRVPNLDPDHLGERPAVPSTQRQLLREYADQAGIPTPTTRDGLPYGHKTGFDEFARRRKREMIGQVPGATSYQEWLSTQPAWFQDDVLGKTKGRLFRDGQLTLDKFVNRRGGELTLSQLAELHASAFQAAGLDPGAFR